MNNKRPFIPSWLFKQGFNSHQFTIYSYVSMRGDCFENKRSMCKAMKMGVNAFYKHLAILVAAGWISASASNGKVTLRCLTNGRQIEKSAKPVEETISTMSQQDRYAMLKLAADQKIVRGGTKSTHTPIETSSSEKYSWLQ